MTTNVTFAGATQVAGVTEAWTFGYQSTAVLDRTQNISITFPSGFSLAGVFTGSGGPPSIGGCVLSSGFVVGSYVYFMTKGALTVNLYLYRNDGTNVVPANTPVTFSVPGITNPAAGSYAASGFSIVTYGDSTPGHPSAPIEITGAVIPPTVTDLGPADCTADAATIEGQASAGGGETTALLRYGTDPTLSSGTSTIAADQSPLPPEATDAAISATLSGLAAETLYYRWELENSANPGDPVVTAIGKVAPVGTRYWVGGGATSAWSDPDNWSASSGGAGGVGQPTTATLARFDANSFSAPGESVTIDDPDGMECGGMDWTGALHTPELDVGTDSHLYIAGPVTLIEGMTIAGNVDVVQGVIWDTSPPLAVGSPIEMRIDMAGQTIPQTNVNPTSIEGQQFIGSGSVVLDSAFLQPVSHLMIYVPTWDANGHAVQFRVMAQKAGNVTLDLAGITLLVRDYAVIQGAEMEGVELTTQPDIDYVGLAVGTQHLASWRVKKQWAAGTTFDLTLATHLTVDRLTLEKGTNNEIPGFSSPTATLKVSELVSEGTAAEPVQITGTFEALAVLEADYLELTDCVLTGAGVPSYAGSHSIDHGGNVGWLFEDPPAPPVAPLGTAAPVSAALVLERIRDNWPRP